MKSRYTGRYAVFFDVLYIVELYEGDSYSKALTITKDAKNYGNVCFYDNKLNKELEI